MLTLGGSLAFTTNVYLYLPNYLYIPVNYTLFKITLLGTRSISL